MKCISCGVQNTVEALFCRNCGTGLERGLVEAPAEEEPDVTVQSEYQESERNVPDSTSPCENCGSFNDDEALFCRNCGTSIREGLERAEVGAQQQVNRRSRNWIGWVAIAVVGIALLFQCVPGFPHSAIPNIPVSDASPVTSDAMFEAPPMAEEFNLTLLPSDITSTVPAISTRQSHLETPTIATIPTRQLPKVTPTLITADTHRNETQLTLPPGFASASSFFDSIPAILAGKSGLIKIPIRDNDQEVIFIYVAPQNPTAHNDLNAEEIPCSQVSIFQGGSGTQKVLYEVLNSSQRDLLVGFNSNGLVLPQYVSAWSATYSGNSVSTPFRIGLIDSTTDECLSAFVFR